MKRREVINALKAGGFELVRYGGNHDIYFNPATKITIPVKRHMEIDDTTVKKLLRQAGLR